MIQEGTMAYRRRPVTPPVGLYWLAVVVLLLLACAGYFGAWVADRSAGLVITGVDLAEYVKFLPPVQSGQIQVRREAFYVPLVSASLTATLLAGRRGLPRWLRVLLALAAIPLALAMLPPAWNPAVLLEPEFRVQVLAILVCLAAVPAILITRYIPDRLIMLVIALLALAAALWPAWSFQQVLPSIEDFYGHPLRPGWGFFACVIANLGIAFYGVARTLTLPRG
jgi:hypothetical protein